MSESKCPECGSQEQQRIETAGEIICKNCGLVLEDSEIETKPFLPESKKALATNPYLSEAGGREVSGKIVKAIWLKSTKEKNYEQIKAKLSILASKHKLPQSVITEANILYKKALAQNLNIGRDNLNLLYGCIYASCLMYKIPRTPIELTIFNEVSEKTIVQNYKLITRKLNIKLETLNPLDLIPRFASKLKMPVETITKALEIANKALTIPLFKGKKPQTISAVAIYLAGIKTDCKRTQREIANTTGVIEMTIRIRSRQLANCI